MTNNLAHRRAAHKSRENNGQGQPTVALAGMGTKPPGKSISVGQVYGDTYWENQLNKVQAFRTAHDRWPDRNSSSPEEQHLAVWLANQRIMWRTGCLPARRQQALADAGARLEPGLEPAERDARWAARLAALQAFHAAHSRWPAESDRDPKARSLASWLDKQRRLYRAGKLSGQRRQALDDAGAADGGKKPAPADRWLDRLAQVVAYQTRYGRWPSATLGDHQEAVDAVWLIRQRTAARRGLLSEPRRQALAEAGVELEPWETRWVARMAELEAFHTTQGRWPAKTSPDLAEQKLAAWLAYQQKNPRPEHRQTLLDAGVKIGPPPKHWGRRKHPDEWLAELETFHNIHRRWPTKTSGDTAERRLGCWLNNQRYAYQTGRMSRQQQQALTGLGVDLAPGRGQARKDNLWAARLADVQAFRAAHNRWPTKNVGDPDEQHLWVWLSNQRSAYRAGKMSAQRQQAWRDAGMG